MEVRCAGEQAGCGLRMPGEDHTPRNCIGRDNNELPQEVLKMNQDNQFCQSLHPDDRAKKTLKSISYEYCRREETEDQAVIPLPKLYTRPEPV